MALKGYRIPKVISNDTVGLQRDYIPCLRKKLRQCYFLNNSVKHWPILIIFGAQP